MKKGIYLSILLITMLLWSCSKDGENADLEALQTAEYTALMDFYNNTDGANWAKNTGWGDKNTLHQGGWHGVGIANGRVNLIKLTNNKLKGNIPESIGALTALKTLNLSFNYLTGTLPESFSRLTDLTDPNLSINTMMGRVPQAVQSMPQFLEWWQNELFAQVNGYGLYLNEAVQEIDLGSGIYLHPGYNMVAMVVSQATYSQWYAYNNENYLSFTNSIYEKFKDEFDFILLTANSTVLGSAAGGTVGRYSRLQCATQGIGLQLSDIHPSYGSSSGKLQGILNLYIRNGLIFGPSLHELCHNWGARIVPTFDFDENWQQIPYDGHWGISDADGQLGGFTPSTLVQNVDGNPKKYKAGSHEYRNFWGNNNGGNAHPYSKIELYLMGLIPPEQVPPLRVFEGISTTAEEFSEGVFYANKINTYTIDDIVATHGPRVPSSADAQKEFKAIYVVLATKKLTPGEWEAHSEWVKRFCFKGNDSYPDNCNFYEATSGLASISMGNLDQVRK